MDPVGERDTWGRREESDDERPERGKEEGDETRSRGDVKGGKECELIRRGEPSVSMVGIYGATGQQGQRRARGDISKRTSVPFDQTILGSRHGPLLDSRIHPDGLVNVDPMMRGIVDPSITQRCRRFDIDDWGGDYALGSRGPGRFLGNRGDGDGSVGERGEGTERAKRRAAGRAKDRSTKEARAEGRHGLVMVSEWWGEGEEYVGMQNFDGECSP